MQIRILLLHKIDLQKATAIFPFTQINSSIRAPASQGSALFASTHFLPYAKTAEIFLHFLCTVNIKRQTKMENYISAAPLWAILLFIVSFLFSLAIIARPFRQAALNAGMTPRRSTRIRNSIIIFYLLWLGYASVLALKGTLFFNTLPPRPFVFLTIPLLLILFAIVGNTNLFKKLVRSASLESLISMHVFRVLGIFFFLLSFYKLLDPQFAVSAGLGDIITAIFAIPIARSVAQQKPWSRKLAYAWSIFGSLDILNLMTIATYGAIKATAAGQTGGEMTIFPFVWFPAFAPATILFLHYTIFRKLRQTSPSRRHGAETPRPNSGPQTPVNQNYA
jgi:hypothetical protein